MKTRLFRMALIASCAGLFITQNLLALENGLARTPPMGFNTWNWFGCSDRNHGTISDTLIRSIANAMVTRGLKDSGYQYVNIDDCWGESSRDSKGGLVPRKANFPNGMRALADYVHSKGLKLGIYTDVATATCAWTMPGLQGHENQDADSFVSWGVDYVKVDWCGHNADPAIAQYSRVRNALRSAVTRMKPTVPTAHELVFSMCNWGEQSPWLWGDTVGNLWRTTGDIDQTWAGCSWPNPCWKGIMATMDGTADKAKYAGPGHWNDPDMLEVGNGATSNAEDRAHFSLWCIMAAPIICGNDIRTMNEYTRSVLINGEVIRVDQDSLGKAGVRVTTGNSEVWVKKMSSLTSEKTDTNYALLFFNRNNSGPATMNITMSQIQSAVGGGITAGKIYQVRDLWNHKDLGEWTAGTYTTPSAVAVHDVFMVRLSPKPAVSTLTRMKSVGGKIQFDEKENVLVNASNSTPVSIMLNDLKGALAYSHRSVGPSQCALAKVGIPKGLYLLKVQSGKESLVQRVLLK